MTIFHASSNLINPRSKWRSGLGPYQVYGMSIHGPQSMEAMSVIVLDPELYKVIVENSNVSTFHDTEIAVLGNRVVSLSH